MAGRIRDDDIAEVRDKARIDEVVSQYVTLRNAGGGSQKGLCPFHDEKSPSFNVNPTRQFWHCFGCGEGGDVFNFLMKIDGLSFVEAVERLAEKYGVQLRREEGDARDERPKGPQRSRLIEAQPGRPGVLRRAARPRPTPLVARQFLHERGFDQDAADTFGVGFAPARRRGGLQAPAAEGLQPGGDGRGRAGRDRPVGVRPLPRAAALADPRRQRRHDRVRRAPDLRRRQDRGEVPQHPRDQDLQEEPGALRHRPRPPRHGAVVAGRRGRGLHRRDGLPPRRRDHRGRDLRHRLRRRAREGAAAVPPRPRGVPRRGDLHLRRRRRRAEGRAAGVRGRPELRLPDLRRRRARRPRPVRPADPEGRRRRARAGRPAGAALPLRARQRRRQVRPRPRRRPGRRRPRGRPAGVEHPRQVQGRRVLPRARRHGRRRHRAGPRRGTPGRQPPGRPPRAAPCPRPAGREQPATAPPRQQLPDLRDPRFSAGARDAQAGDPAPRRGRPLGLRRRPQRLHPPDLPRGVGARRRAAGGPIAGAGDDGWADRLRDARRRPGRLVGDQRARRRAAAHGEGARPHLRRRRTSTGCSS